MADFSQEGPVDVEAIMEEIRRRAREEFHGPRDESTLREELEFVLDNCRLDIEQAADSPPPRVGPLTSWVRKALLTEVRRLVDPVLEKQTVWNQKVAGIVQKQEAEIERLRRALAERAGGPAAEEKPSEPAPADSSAPPP